MLQAPGEQGPGGGRCILQLSLLRARGGEPGREESGGGAGMLRLPGPSSLPQPPAGCPCPALPLLPPQSKPAARGCPRRPPPRAPRAGGEGCTGFSVPATRSRSGDLPGERQRRGQRVAGLRERAVRGICLGPRRTAPAARGGGVRDGADGRSAGGLPRDPLPAHPCARGGGRRPERTVLARRLGTSSFSRERQGRG